MSRDAESKKQQEMMSMLPGESDAFSQLSLIPGAAEQVLALAAAADPVFFNQPPGSPYPVGETPYAVAVGDFNGDGKLDIVTANLSSTVSVLLGKGGGTFQVQPPIPVGGNPEAVAVGDFNGDGKLDIVVGLRFAFAISVLLGKGDGTFQTPQNIPVDGSVVGVAVGDFNHDGNLDIVTANAQSTVSVLLGNGDGTFQNSQTYFVGSVPKAVAVGDFNGDNKLDIVVTNAGDNTVSVLLGKGDGTFQVQLPIPVGGSPTGVAVGDFNGDGKLDIVTANDGSNNATVLLQSPLVVNVETIQAVATMPFSGAVATISGASSAGDTTAMIDWGDSTPTTVGTVSGSGTLTVSGSHIYSRGGLFTLIVTAIEGTRTTTGTGQAIVKTANLRARAFGVQSLNPPQGPFGDVSIPSTGGNQAATAPLTLLPGLVVGRITDTVSGSLTPTPPHADASSTIGGLVGFSITHEMIEDPDQQTLVALGISATAHADLSMPSGVLSGATSFTTLIIGSTIFPAHFTPGANTVVQLPGLGTVTLNEQTVTQNANQILIVVNALHIHITQGPQAGTDIVVGHVEAGITLS